jgi:hypothetical protein
VSIIEDRSHVELHLEWDDLGRNLPWYGRLLEEENEDDARIIFSQRAAKLEPFPIVEERDHVRRTYADEIRRYYEEQMTAVVSEIVPVCTKFSFKVTIFIK